MRSPWVLCITGDEKVISFGGTNAFGCSGDRLGDLLESEARELLKFICGS
jgi:hypothetical protein